MKPGREHVPEIGAISEAKPFFPEEEHRKNVERAVEFYGEFINSFRPTAKSKDFDLDIEYRKRVAEQFSTASQEHMRSLRQKIGQLAKNTRAFLDSYTLIDQEILKENRDTGRISKAEFFSHLQDTVRFQQDINQLILQHRFVPDLDSSLQKFWNTFEKASSIVITDPDFAKKQEHGIEHAVTASHLLEERGWRIHKPRVKADIEEGTDAFATGVTPEGKEIILALQFKPTSAAAFPFVDVKVLYPFPAQADVEEDAWNLVESVKRHRLKNPNLPLFPVIMRIPPSENTAHIRRGTGLLASSHAADTLLDEQNKKALEYAEMLADIKTTTNKPKKRITYVPQGK